MTEQSLTVLVNRAGGAAASAGEALPDTLTAAFEAAGARADVRMLEAIDMADAVVAAAKQGRFVVAGGDGTIACAAQALKGSDAELALLPLGTLNHLARDIGVPNEIEAAAALAVNGKATAIDVGEVNGHRFVNNASIGLYPSMVRHRDDTRDRQGWPKWLATIPAAWDVLSRLPHHRLRIDTGNGERPIVTPMLFVGNNHYTLEPGSVGTRASLTEGKLSVFAVARRSRVALIWFAMRTLAGKANRAADFIAIGDCEALKVWSTGGPIEIALDGEVMHLASPLCFRIERGALKVVAPPLQVE